MIKKFFTDGVLQLAIVLSLLRTDLYSFVNNRTNYPEIQEIILGSSSAYTQTNFHSSNWLRDGIAHPKNIDSLYESEIFHELYVLGNSRRFARVETNIDAWLVDTVGSGSRISLPATTADSNNNHDNNSTSSSGPSQVVNQQNVHSDEGASGPRQENQSGIAFPGSELTKEDMDLIEVLWRQDIDLGVGREMYDVKLRQKMEKDKELELQKEQEKEKAQEATIPPDTSTLPQPGVNYQIDEETGELIAVPAPMEDGSLQIADMPPSLDDTSLTIEDAMRLLEEQVEPVSEYNTVPTQLPSVSTFITPSIQQPQTVPDVTEQLEETDIQSEIEAMIQNAQNFNHQQNQIGFMRQDSFDRCWDDVANILNLQPSEDLLSQEEIPQIHISPIPQDLNNSTMVNLTGDENTMQPLLHNASLAPPPSNSDLNPYGMPMVFGAENSSMEHSTLGAQNLQNAISHFLYSNSSMSDNNDTASLFNLDTNDLMFANLSGPPQGMLTAGANEEDDGFGDTENLLQQLIDTASPRQDLVDSSLAEGLESVRMMDRASVSSDSAVSSLGSSSSPPRDMNDSQSTFSEPSASSGFDGLEGATGGADDFDYLSLSSDDKKNLPKLDPYQTEVKFSAYGYRDASNINMNTTTSNDSSDGYNDGYKPAEMRHVKHNHTYPLHPGQMPKEYKPNGKKSSAISASLGAASQDPLTSTRDLKKAKALKIPLTPDQIITTSVEEFNELLGKHKLSEPQLQLIRDIRRRGKNKIAAQNCRKRKMGVILSLEDEVVALRAEKAAAMRQRASIEKEMSEFRQKMDAMQQEVFRSLRDDDGQPYDPSQYVLQHTSDGNVFLMPRNSTANDHEEKRTKKRKPKKNH